MIEFYDEFDTAFSSRFRDYKSGISLRSFMCIKMVHIEFVYENVVHLECNIELELYENVVHLECNIELELYEDVVHLECNIELDLECNIELDLETIILRMKQPNNGCYIDHGRICSYLS